jgi:hypothetical protein
MFLNHCWKSGFELTLFTNYMFYVNMLQVHVQRQRSEFTLVTSVNNIFLLWGWLFAFMNIPFMSKQTVLVICSEVA